MTTSKMIQTAFALLVLHCISCEPANAADDQRNACVEVEVDGARARSIECLNALLQNGGEDVLPPASLLLSEGLLVHPPNQLGLFNRAATSNQMGNSFGKSAIPQRPEATPVINPFKPSGR